MAEEKASRAKSSMSGGGKKKSSSHSKSKSHPHEIRIRKGKSGGHIVTHHELPDESGVATDPEEHVMPDQASLLQHIAANTDDQAAPQAAPPDPSQQAGPAVAAAGPGPGGPPQPQQGM